MILLKTKPKEKDQRGAVLVVSLLFLTVMTILGVSSMGTNILEEKMVSNSHQKRLAFQAADSCTSRVLKENSFSSDSDWSNVWENEDGSIEAVPIGSVDAKNNATFKAEKKNQGKGANPNRGSGYSMEKFSMAFNEYRCTGEVSSGAVVVIRQGTSRITPKINN